ncbi:MAG: dUTP diphosphatase [Colwellia sp.]|nr:dUTP diphosphatase [Colwellia sp.]
MATIENNTDVGTMPSAKSTQNKIKSQSRVDNLAHGSIRTQGCSYNEQEMRTDVIGFTCLNSNATIPTRSCSNDAGLDLAASESCVVLARQRLCVATGLSIALPNNTYGRIASRSGLAVKRGIDVGAGVVDQGYTGELKVLLFNHSDEDFVIEIGDRIAQIVVTVISTAPVIDLLSELPVVPSPKTTVRRLSRGSRQLVDATSPFLNNRRLNRGFGSSGV